MDKYEKLEEIFKLLNMESSFDFIYQSLVSTFKIDEKELTDKFMTRWKDTVLPKILLKVKEVWIECYTEEEIDGLLIFYKTPVGRSFVSKQAVAAKAVIINLQELNSELESMSKEIIDEMFKDNSDDLDDIISKQDTNSQKTSEKKIIESTRRAILDKDNE
tara:strand:+ start:4121 stop:4603 length:483 start_codon:yes stop_codon:yes gene_type:complete